MIHRNALIAMMAGCLMLCVSCGQRSRAADDYETVASEPNRDTERARRLNDEAYTLIQAGEYESAEPLLKRALRADVMYGPAHNNLGKLYYYEKKLYQAAWEFEYAAKLMPNATAPRNNLGLVFESVGKLDQAIDAYAMAMELEPANTLVVGNLARARIRRGDRDPDIKDLLRLIVMKDERPEWVAWAEKQLHLLHVNQDNRPRLPGTQSPKPRKHGQRLEESG